MEPQSPPPPASPFNPQPQPAVPQGRSGCSKPVVVGCVAVFLIGAIALLGGVYYVGTHAAALLQWSFRQMENGLMAQLPKDVTPQEKAELQQAFTDIQQALKSGKIPPEQLQPLQFKMMEVGRKGSNLTRRDIVELTRSLEQAAGKPVTNSGPNSGP